MKVNHRRIVRSWYQANDRGLTKAYKPVLMADSNTAYRTIGKSLVKQGLLELTQERAEAEQARIDEVQDREEEAMLFDELLMLLQEQDRQQTLKDEWDWEPEPEYTEPTDEEWAAYEEQQARREQTYLENDSNW